MKCLLFYIDKSIGIAIESGELSEVEHSVFQDLAVSVQKGCCIVCGEYHSLSLLANRDDNVGDVFKKILSKYAMQRTIIDKVNVVFCICKNASQDLPSFISEKAIEIRLQRIVTSRWDIFQKCILLCENLKDCTFYSFLGENYCSHNNITDYHVSFMNLGGGGQTTAETYKNMVCEEKRSVLCVVDSDKKYANTCPLGKTCVAVKNEVTGFTELDPPFYTVILPLHEIENIIPLVILAEIYKSDPLINEYILLLKKLSEIENGTPLLCYDFKKGCTNLHDEDDMSYYWKSIATSHHIDLSKFNNVFPAIVDRKYLSKVNEFLRTNANRHEFLVFDTYIATIIQQLEKDLFSWGCVGKPIFV